MQFCSFKDANNEAKLGIVFLLSHYGENPCRTYLEAVISIPDDLFYTAEQDRIRIFKAYNSHPANEKHGLDTLKDGFEKRKIKGVLIIKADSLVSEETFKTAQKPEREKRCFFQAVCNSSWRVAHRSLYGNRLCAFGAGAF